MERRRILKRALILSAAAIATAFVAFGVLVDRMLSTPDIKPRIEKAIADYLGRPVTIDSLEWRRTRGVLVGKGLKAYDDEARAQLVVDAPVVEAHIALLSLFKLSAGITELRFVSPRVFLRRRADGTWNAAEIVHGIASRPGEEGRSWGTLAFNWFTVVGGTVTVEDAIGDLGRLPPLEVDASGKLRIGRRHAHFPFSLQAAFVGKPASLALYGDLGGRQRLHARLERGDPALALSIYPPAAEWRKAEWGAKLDYDEHESEAWKFDIHTAPVVLSTDVPALDSLDAKATYLPPSFTFAGVALSSANEVDVEGASNGAAIDLDIKSRRTEVSSLVRIVHVESLLSAAADRRLARRMKARKGPKPSSRPAPPSKITATISVDRLLWGDTTFRDVRAAVSRSTSPWVLERLTMNGLGGSIEGNAVYEPAANGTLSLDWRTSDVSLQELFRVAGSSREAAGTLDSTGHIKTELGDRFLPAMNGNVQLDLKNGWFSGLPGLLKIMTKLNLATLFAKVGKRHQARVPFDEAHAALTIVDGKMTTDRPLHLKNKTLEIAFMGSLVLPTNDIDGKVVVHVLAVTDEIIKLIPGVRDVLLAGQKSMTPIWVKVTGKADNPEVTVQETKTITAPVWNTLKRIFTLPKKLWDKLAGE